MRFEDLTGRSVVIWGAGREARAAHQELARRGIDSTLAVTDQATVPQDLRAITATGPKAVARLESAQVIVKSPGIARTAPAFRRLAALGVPLTSLTDLWLADNARRTVAVTGTKGKSTTSALIAHLLRKAGVGVSLVGNLGTPVTAEAADAATLAVAEISSYQAADLTVSPRLAVVTSLYPEHLPWHGGFEQYVHDKLNLVAHGPEAVIIPDGADELARLVADRAGPATRVIRPSDAGLTVTASSKTASGKAAGLGWEGVGWLAAADLPLRGAHNLANAALAVAAADLALQGLGRTWARSLEPLRSFAPLAHRLEPVPSGDGRTWIDDSLATAPEAVVAALAAYPDARVTLLLGGADRGLSFAPLTSYLAGRPARNRVGIIAVGPAGRRFTAEAASAIGGRDEGGPANGDGAANPGGTATGAAAVGPRLAPDFATALTWASANPADSDMVMLSPGAPSFDEFDSFEERSAAFRAAAAAA
ncbi:MAG: UDP-N-acetylmuramoyl-L-alanine--D-glutamate ligase [Bifidobacteriaceae bacterium]|nr:UDP-N-acetylmuramoyl-L-alanine--D-glutamate ligase [Bifidobacteriaceae bacterium]